MKQHRSLDHRARFDVVAILWPADGSPPRITHYRHAFEARLR
jgi:putative endonuclease